MAYKEVRHEETHKLLFRYDPDTERIEIVARGEVYEVCLEIYRTEYCRYSEGIDSRPESCYTNLRELG